MTSGIRYQVISVTWRQVFYLRLFSSNTKRLRVRWVLEAFSPVFIFLSFDFIFFLFRSHLFCFESSGHLGHVISAHRKCFFFPFLTKRFQYALLFFITVEFSCYPCLPIFHYLPLFLSSHSLTCPRTHTHTLYLWCSWYLVFSQLSSAYMHKHAWCIYFISVAR